MESGRTGGAACQAQAVLPLRRPQSPPAEEQDGRVQLKRQPPGPHGQRDRSSGKPQVRMLHPHVPLDEQPGVIRRRLGRHGP